MHCFPRRKARFRWKLHQCLEGLFGRGHVIQQLVHHPLLQGWRQLFLHLQLARSGLVLVDQQIQLVLHQVDE